MSRPRSLRSRLRAGAVALALPLAAAPALAGPLFPTKPSQLVTAAVVDEMSTVEGVKEPFAIPPRQVLVITSVQFGVVGPAGDSFGMNLLAGTASAHAVLAQTLAKTEAEGVGSVTLPLPTGVAIREGNALCFAASAGGSPIGSVTGFFAKDK